VGHRYRRLPGEGMGCVKECLKTLNSEFSQIQIKPEKTPDLKNALRVLQTKTPVNDLFLKKEVTLILTFFYRYTTDDFAHGFYV